MKKILPVMLAVVGLISCQRAMDLLNDIPLPPGIDSSRYQSGDTTCEVIAQTSPYINMVPESQAFGFRKVFNVNTGKVDSLITAIGNPLEVDSILYGFEYLPDNKVHVSGVIKTYNRFNSPQEWELDNATMIDMELNFDEKGNLVLIGGLLNEQFNYQNGMLQTIDRPTNPAPYQTVTFSYDTSGNLVKVMQGDEANNFSVKYEYDYSKTARSQLYSPIPIYQLFVYEIMGWIPIPSKNLRTKQVVINRTTTGGVVNETVQKEIVFSNHVINEMGALQSFDAHIININLNATITNTLDCTFQNRWHLPR